MKKQDNKEKKRKFTPDQVKELKKRTREKTGKYVKKTMP